MKTRVTKQSLIGWKVKPSESKVEGGVESESAKLGRSWKVGSEAESVVESEMESEVELRVEPRAKVEGCHLCLANEGVLSRPAGRL